MVIRILLAVNDHRNGEPDGHVRALEIPDVISLEAPEPAPIGGVNRRVSRLRIAGKTYRVLDYCGWVGNMVWDAVTVSDDDAVDILDRLRKTERWTIEEAEHTVYGTWERGEKILIADLRMLPDSGAGDGEG